MNKWFREGDKTTLETSEEDVDKTTLETSEEDVDKTTLETSEEDVDKTTLETSEEDVDKTTLETSEGDVDKTTLETSVVFRSISTEEMSQILTFSAEFSQNKKRNSSGEPKKLEKSDRLRILNVSDEMLGAINVTVFDRIAVRVEACDEDFRFK